MTGFFHVRPPSVERFTSAVFLVSTVSDSASQTPCFAS